MTSHVHVAFNDDHTRAAFTFTHPTGNIITADIVDALRAGLESVSSNPHLKLITIEGAGGDFSFGASIPEHTPAVIADVLPRMHALVLDLLEAPAATAAVVRGRCLGGGFELALACDFILAADDAVFGLPEIKLGVFPPAGAALLPRRAGAARAASTVLTAATRGVTYWAEAGLIEMTAPGAGFEGAVDAWFARTLAPLSASAVRHAAAAVRMGLLDEVRRTLPLLERLYLEDLMRTSDAVEGVQAFIEKRAPRWSDR